LHQALISSQLPQSSGATCSIPAPNLTPLDAALALFCAQGGHVKDPVCNRAQDFLAHEVLANQARQIDIAITLFKSDKTSTENRDLAQAVLVSHLY
jgi:hypothetical protein